LSHHSCGCFYTDSGPSVIGNRLARSLTEPGRERPHILSPDTFGTPEPLATSIHAEFHRVDSGRDKLDYIEFLGAQQCVAIGNGRNDGPMIRAAGLGIAVLGPGGFHAEALTAADVIAFSIDEALRLLADARTLTATR